MKKIILASTILITTITSLSHALSVETHKAINAYIAQNALNGFSLDSYLTNTLGIQNGIETQFSANGNNQEAWKWLRDGGLYEDEPPSTLPYIRSVNHFHDPLKAIDQAGFTGVWGTGILSGKSAILWSQSAKQTQSPGGYYSWPDARQYFYNALTSSTKSVRDTNFADTFRGLGQLMHLVQDMSVPEHTRDDGHYFGDFYEEYVAKNQSNNLFSTALTNPTFFPMTGLTQLDSAFSTASVPIANLFDTDQYSGTNPSITLNQIIGLSEYTNANFVSTDTIFSSGFKYPSKATSVQEVDLTIQNPMYPGGTIARKYYYKIADGDTNYLLAGVGYLRFYADENNILLSPDKIVSPMDDYVHAGYAQRLLPRAVGYSAALLNYFFRGQIDMIPDDTTGSGYVIVNKTDEDMDGTFELYYNKENPDDERAKIDLSIGKISLGKQSSGDNKSQNITFNVPTDAKNPGDYILVFQGKLGNEEKAVVGKLVSLIDYQPVMVMDDGYILCDKKLNPVKFVASGSGIALAPSLQRANNLSSTSSGWSFSPHPNADSSKDDGECNPDYSLGIVHYAYPIGSDIWSLHSSITYKGSPIKEENAEYTINYNFTPVWVCDAEYICAFCGAEANISGTQTEQATGHSLYFYQPNSFESISGKILAYYYQLAEPAFDASGTQTLSPGRPSHCCEITGHMPVTRSGNTRYGNSSNMYLNINGTDILLVDTHQIYTSSPGCVDFYNPITDWYSTWAYNLPCTSSNDIKNGSAYPVYLNGFQYLENVASESLCATSKITDGSSLYAFYLVYYDDGSSFTKKYPLNGNTLTVLGHNLTLSGYNSGPILYMATER